MRLLGSVLLDQLAQGALRSVLVQGSINPDLPTAATFCVCSYLHLQLLIRHGFDFE
jgi:hypothetical protein